MGSNDGETLSLANKNGTSKERESSNVTGTHNRNCLSRGGRRDYDFNMGVPDYCNAGALARSGCSWRSRWRALHACARSLLFTSISRRFSTTLLVGDEIISRRMITHKWMPYTRIRSVSMDRWIAPATSVTFTACRKGGVGIEGHARRLVSCCTRRLFYRRKNPGTWQANPSLCSSVIFSSNRVHAYSSTGAGGAGRCPWGGKRPSMQSCGTQRNRRLRAS